MDKWDILGDRLLYLLDYMNLVHKKLCEDMGRSTGFISNIVHGRNLNPDKEFYAYFEERFNVNPEWLSKGVGEPFLEGGVEDNFNLGKAVSLMNCLSDETYHAVMVILRELANRKFLEQIRESFDEK